MDMPPTQLDPTCTVFNNLDLVYERASGMAAAMADHFTKVRRFTSMEEPPRSRRR